MPTNTMRLVPTLVFLLAVNATAQQHGAERGKLLKQNAALQKAVTEKDAEIARLRAQLVRQEVLAKLVPNTAKAKQAKALAPRAVQGFVFPKQMGGKPVQLAQPVQWSVRGRVQRNPQPHVFWGVNGWQVQSPNPLVSGEYKKALDQLTSQRTKLDHTQDPVQARKLVDAMSRQLLEVRRTLWELEQKAKKAKQNTATKNR